MVQTKLVNCKVLTPTEEYDSIVFDTSVLSLNSSDKAERTIDLDGSIVVPGFIDSHAHLTNSEVVAAIPISNLSREETIATIVKGSPNYGQWLVVRGWDESTWTDKSFILPSELDTDFPVLAIRVDGHMAVLNSRGAKIAREIGFHVDEDNIIKEDDELKLRDKILRENRSARNFRTIEDFCFSKGVTSISDIDFLHKLDFYKQIDLRLRVVFSILENSEVAYKTGDPIKENLFMGFTKLFADGSIGARTAVTSLPYIDSDAKPELIYTDEQLLGAFRTSLDSGRKPMVHAIGDEAVRQVLRVGRSFPAGSFRIEHNEITIPEEIEEEESGVTVSMQPNFLRWAKPGGLYETRLGSEVLEHNNNYAALLKKGVKLSFSSDSMPLDPLYGIKLAIESEYQRQRLTFEEALKAYTIDSAASLNIEQFCGSLEKGKAADIVVLEPKGFKIKATYSGGKLVYGDPGTAHQ